MPLNNKPTIAVCVTSLAASSQQVQAMPPAIKLLGQYFNVKVYKDIRIKDRFDSQSSSDRIKSLNWAADNGDIVLAWTGGYNSVELLYDFDSIKITRDKIFVGYSDNTILVNALPAKAACRAWQGPMLANWVRTPQFGGLWAECILALYYDDFQKLSELYNQLGMTVFRTGTMKGKIWGGNNYSFDLLQGTEFCPAFIEPFILLLEGEDFIVDKKRVWQDFIRNLDSIMLLPGAEVNLRGLIIGRFPASYQIDTAEVELSLKNRRYLDDVPVVYNFPRGYCEPALYLPIGEKLSIRLKKNNSTEFDRV